MKEKKQSHHGQQQNAVQQLFKSLKQSQIPVFHLFSSSILDFGCPKL